MANNQRCWIEMESCSCKEDDRSQSPSNFFGGQKSVPKCQAVCLVRLALASPSTGLDFTSLCHHLLRSLSNP